MFAIDAPAKLNLTLKVLGRRDDGFHEIDTTMIRLPGLCDRLTFTEADGYDLVCDDGALPVGEGNLVTKAVRAYEAVAGRACRHRVKLEKRIPHGAGLGGGSSDAASTLRALDQLSPEPLGDAKLLEIAAGLGSDIPFFLGSDCARCTGRGEIIEAAAAPPIPLRVLLLKPSFAVLTPDAYRRWAGAVPLAGVREEPQDLDGLMLQNDLERPVFGKHRFLAEMKCWLLGREEVAGAQLCGSGSTMFAVLHVGEDPDALASSARLELDPHLWTWSGDLPFTNGSCNGPQIANG